jgi:hypothetical protein
MDNKNNGLITKIWGPPCWDTLHAFSFGYPYENPTSEQKEHYKAFYYNLQYVLPCVYCRNSYSHFIKTKPTILDDSVMENRESLTRWLYKLHQRVNNKLGCEYMTSYKDLCDKWEECRAKCVSGFPGCVMPVKDKVTCYKKMYEKKCCIIKYRLARYFIDYAKKIGFENYEKELNKYYELCKNKNTQEWEERNKKCYKKIKDMRLNGVDFTYSDGENKGLPTRDELELMSMLCSNICENDLYCVIRSKLNINIKRKYIIKKD